MEGWDWVFLTFRLLIFEGSRQRRNECKIVTATTESPREKMRSLLLLAGCVCVLAQPSPTASTSTLPVGSVSPTATLSLYASPTPASTPGPIEIGACVCGCYCGRPVTRIRPPRLAACAAHKIGKRADRLWLVCEPRVASHTLTPPSPPHTQARSGMCWCSTAPAGCTCFHGCVCVCCRGAALPLRPTVQIAVPVAPPAPLPPPRPLPCCKHVVLSPSGACAAAPLAPPPPPRRETCPFLVESMTLPCPPRFPFRVCGPPQARAPLSCGVPTLTPFPPSTP